MENSNLLKLLQSLSNTDVTRFYEEKIAFLESLRKNASDKILELIQMEFDRLPKDISVEVEREKMQIT
ncbi:MAG: hypothetical protein J6X11_12700 [Treponema sp.]|nr:hypothetical protein [Treponema sp.]